MRSHAPLWPKRCMGSAPRGNCWRPLQRDAQLRRICGWEAAWRVPHEATFSRAFEEFARMELPQFVHEALIRDTRSDRLIGHIARDSTAIEAREHFPEHRPKRPLERRRAALDVRVARWSA